MELWPHQGLAISESHRAIKEKVRACVVAPPGAGKSLVMREIARNCMSWGMRVGVMAHRISLVEQTRKSFQLEGIRFGMISSEHKENEDPLASAQIISAPTFYSRIGKRGFVPPKIDLLLIDEAHQQTEKQCKSIVFGSEDKDGKERFEGYETMGAAVLGFTATPVDLGSFYKRLIVAGTYPELRECGAHLPIESYCAEIPDMSGVRMQSNGEFSAKAVKARMKVQTIYGNVLEWWRKLNPEQLPTLLNAPGVDESRWFVQMFAGNGIPAAHIGGGTVMFGDKNPDGSVTVREHELTKSNNLDLRDELLAGSKSGRFKIVCNRFILREGIDMPWIFHSILATAIGSLSTYLQTVGRLQRFYKGYAFKQMQDHGGNFDRHLSPNITRKWRLGITNDEIRKQIHIDKEKNQDAAAEPISCPKCGFYRNFGKTCFKCGHMHTRASRAVRQMDGSLKRKIGRLVTYKKPPSNDDWFRQILYRCASSGKTVAQAYGMAYAIGKEKGINPYEDLNYFKPPEHGSAQWRGKVTDVYPFIRPKKKVAR